MGLLHRRRPPSGNGGALVADPGAAAAPTEASDRPDGAGPRSSRHTIGVRRLIVLAAVAAVAFGLALVQFRDPSERDCSFTTRSDARYDLKLEGPYEGEHDHPTYRLVTTKRGEPLDPSLFCLVSFPGGVVVVVDDVRRAHIHIEREPRESSDETSATP